MTVNHQQKSCTCVLLHICIYVWVYDPCHRASNGWAMAAMKFVVKLPRSGKQMGWSGNPWKLQCFFFLNCNFSGLDLPICDPTIFRQSPTGQSSWKENTLELALLELAVGNSRAQKWQVTFRTKRPLFEERYAVLIWFDLNHKDREGDNCRKMKGWREDLQEPFFFFGGCG